MPLYDQALTVHVKLPLLYLEVVWDVCELVNSSIPILHHSSPSQLSKFEHR